MSSFDIGAVDSPGPAAFVQRIMSIETRLGIRRPAQIDRSAEPGFDSTASFDRVLTRELASPQFLQPVHTTTHLGSSNPTTWDADFEAAGARYGVDPALLQAVAEVESAFNPNAVSPAGAQGLMQFMPGTAAEYGIDPFDPSQAIDAAARYLQSSLARFGSVELALASYNAGPGAVQQYGGIPPFTETQNYVTRVLEAYAGRRA